MVSLTSFVRSSAAWSANVKPQSVQCRVHSWPKVQARHYIRITVSFCTPAEDLAVFPGEIRHEIRPET
jgi:hypothetical protein